MAYGARLESVLGASPRGFESLSLRQTNSPSLSRVICLEDANVFEPVRVRNASGISQGNQLLKTCFSKML